MASVELQIKSLEGVDTGKLLSVFQQAFADYLVPFKLERSSFEKKFIEKLGIDLQNSGGVFHGKQLVGFLYTRTGSYLGKKTAYNGGTGVLPQFRGMSLTTRLYEFLLPKFKKEGVQQCVLEVIDQNKAAIKAYQKVGFKIVRKLKCFKMTANSTNTVTIDGLEVASVSGPDWETYQKLKDFEPSFIDSDWLVSGNLANEKIFEAHLNQQLVGFSIFQPLFGRISQLAVHSEFRNQGIGSNLISQTRKACREKSLTWLNIPESETGTIEKLKSIGFGNQVDQWEMILGI